MRITYICNECGVPIKDDEGHLTTITSNAMRSLRAEREMSGRLVSVSELAAVPAPASWIPTHDACVREDDRSDYFVPVDKIRTSEGLIEMTAHLLEKGWTAGTAWYSVLRASLKGTVGHEKV